VPRAAGGRGASAADLWVVTTYFNSENYSSRSQNYRRFLASMDEAAVPCLIIECAFGDRPFELPASRRILRKRVPAVLWQKERLLNLALEELPASCRKVAWVDADVLLENGSWHVDASRMLDRYSVIQLFDTVIRLPRGHPLYRGEGASWAGFCAEHLRSPGCEREGWFRHGHTGFAWAARRDLLNICGFFDVCLTGSADHLMAHGFVGDFDSPCIDEMIGLGTPLHRAYVDWTAIAYRECRGNVAYLPGRALHLWHGDLEQRKYYQRSQELKRLRFDPRTDIRLSPDGCWAWTGVNPPLERWARELFADRMEDG
jgi:hypothetical protein